MIYRFLVIDSEANRRSSLGRTLKLAFADAVFARTDHFITALHLLNGYAYDAIVVRHAVWTDLETLVSGLREAEADVPVVVMADVDQPGKLTDAGSTHVLRSEEWTALGAVLEEMLAQRRPTQLQP